MPPSSYATYRVCGIPAGKSKEDAEALIKRATSSGSHATVRVKSLASNLFFPDESVATVSFKDTPQVLADINEANEWEIEVSDELILRFDTHFQGCTPLYCPPTQDWKFDLFAISGLNGHAFGSFKKKNGPYMWLRDDLPKKLPEIRIIIYGYDTKLQGSESFQTISDIGLKFQNAIRGVRRPNPKKPLLLLGHSLGGIVIKEAIHTMRDSPDETDQMSFRAISGIMFFGVPNQGMHISSLVPMVGDQANRGFLHTLEHSSMMLRDQAARFSEDVGKLRCDILNFFETQQSPTVLQEEDGKWSMVGPSTVLVDPHSATHGRLKDAGSHRIYPVNRTHSDLVKFSGPYDETYITVLDFLISVEPDIPIFSASQINCLASLFFKEQHRRRDALKPAKGTCEWIEKDKKFVEWQNSPNALLWIRGKPGSGKSMAMKHLFLRLQKEPRRSKDEIIISFFFHGQGIDLQKTRLGLYRSLLHQLYKEFPEDFSDLTEKYKDYTNESPQVSWTVDEMQLFFLKFLPEACEMRRIVLLVDALDEAGEDEARRIVKDLTTIMAKAKPPSSQLRVIFSCRHYPEVDLKGGKTLIMEDENQSDIRLVMEQILRETNILNSSEKKKIMLDILNNSQGVFQWATLALGGALDGKLDGDSSAVTQSLKDVPRDLYSLYKSIIQQPDRHDQRHRTKQRRRLFQWLLFSQRTLSVQELRHALAFDDESGYNSIKEYAAGREFIQPDDMSAAIKSLSRGLAQVKGIHSQSRVEFIHQSVVDFLKDTGLHFLPTESNEDVAKTAHFRISKSCLLYLRMEEVDREFRNFGVHDTNDERQFLKTKHQDWDGRFPLLSYAWNYWVFHAKSRKDVPSEEPSASNDLDLIDSLEWLNDEDLIASWVSVRRILGYPLQQWARGQEFTACYREIDLLTDYEMLHWPNPGSTLIHFLALCGFRDALQLAIEHDRLRLSSSNNSVDSPDAIGMTPLAYSIIGGQIQVMRSLLQAGARAKGSETSKRLGTKVRKSSAAQEVSWWAFPIHLAGLRGNVEVIALLVEHGANIDQRDYRLGNTPLHRAVQDNSITRVEALLLVGANTNVQNFQQDTPLHIAVRNPSRGPKVFPVIRRLLQHHADPDAVDVHGSTPLRKAMYGLDWETAHVLIKLGCNLTNCNHDGKTPLMLAAAEGHLETVDLLVKSGAEVNARDKWGNTALIWAHISCNAFPGNTCTDSLPKKADKHLEVIRILLQHGGDAMMTEVDKTALEFSAEYKDWLTVRLLLYQYTRIEEGIQGPAEEGIQELVGEGTQELVGDRIQESTTDPRASSCKQSEPSGPQEKVTRLQKVLRLLCLK